MELVVGYPLLVERVPAPATFRHVSCCLDGGQALVSLAKIQHEGIQRDVAASFAHFSANGDMQVDVFPADAFMTVFDLAYSEEQLTARYALMTICNLAVVGMNQVFHTHTHTHTHTHALLSARPIWSHNEILVALRYIVGPYPGCCVSIYHHHHQTYMGRRGALPPLVAQLSSEYPDVQHYSARALYRLAANSENHARIRIEGGIGPLIELLISKHEPCQRCAVMALCNLATDANNCAAMVIQVCLLIMRTCACPAAVADRRT